MKLYKFFHFCAKQKRMCNSLVSFFNLREAALSIIFYHKIIKLFKEFYKYVLFLFFDKFVFAVMVKSFLYLVMCKSCFYIRTEQFGGLLYGFIVVCLHFYTSSVLYDITIPYCLYL